MPQDVSTNFPTSDTSLVSSHSIQVKRKGLVSPIRNYFDAGKRHSDFLRVSGYSGSLHFNSNRSK